jgi:hypothetical protein
MKKVSISLLACLFSLAVLTSCNKLGTPCSIAWAVELHAEIAAISAASLAYAQDQSTENCNALKDAYQAYIDALEPYGKCERLTGQEREEWQQALDEAKEDLLTMC